MGSGCSSSRSVPTKTADIEYDKEYDQTMTQYQRWLALRRDETEDMRQEGTSSAAVYNCLKALRLNFPSSIPTYTVVSECCSTLKKYNFTDENTVFGSSVCPDIIRNSLVADFTEAWGENIMLGGLGGFPFLGKSGFEILTDNLPSDEPGNIFILFSSHVGMNEKGEFGKETRMDDRVDQPSCKSSTCAFQDCKREDSGQLSLSKSIQRLDFQQGYVTKCVLNEIAKLDTAKEPMVELPMVLYKHIRKFMFGIIPKKIKGKLALLGGIHINTAPGVPDHFLPLDFEIREEEGKTENLLSELERVQHMSHVLDVVLPTPNVL